MLMKYGLKSERKRRKRNEKVRIRQILEASNVKDPLESVKVGNARTMSRLKDKGCFWMLTTRKKSMVKEMEDRCTQDTLLPSWNASVDSSSAGISALSPI